MIARRGVVAATPGGLSGENLAATRMVVFLGARGSRDDRRARPQAASPHRVLRPDVGTQRQAARRGGQKRDAMAAASLAAACHATPNGGARAILGCLSCAGRALDVGCGEGGDALSLARHGWRVTAVDISQTALQRAAAAATEVTGSVAWVRADMTATPPQAGAFELVSVQYFPLSHQPDHSALRGLLDAVAPGGTLLFVSHDPADLNPTPRLRPQQLLPADDIARLLDHSWTVVIDETRPRTAPAPAGTHHTHDTVLRAQRLR